ncbi:MAG TPA: TetR/AcrR family transcriptional regulator [Kiloniellales bacterium]|nr:TetR/AcrR family transcriptional regulator [Kiloniellales bacterium]
MRKAEATQARIERAAVGLFAAHGVDQTTTRELAEAAGIAEGTIYRHYDSKDELIGRIFMRHYRALAEDLEALRRADPEPRRALSAMIARFCALYESEPDLFRFLFFVQHGQLEKVSPEAPSPVRVIRATLAEAMAEGAIPARDPELSTALVLGAVTQPAVFRIYGRLGRPLTALAGDIADACWRLLAT